MSDLDDMKTPEPIYDTQERFTYFEYQFFEINFETKKVYVKKTNNILELFINDILKKTFVITPDEIVYDITFATFKVVIKTFLKPTSSKMIYEVN